MQLLFRHLLRAIHRPYLGALEFRFGSRYFLPKRKNLDNERLKTKLRPVPSGPSLVGLSYVEGIPFAWLLAKRRFDTSCRFLKGLIAPTRTKSAGVKAA